MWVRSFGPEVIQKQTACLNTRPKLLTVSTGKRWSGLEIRRGLPCPPYTTTCCYMTGVPYFGHMMTTKQTPSTEENQEIWLKGQKAFKWGYCSQTSRMHFHAQTQTNFIVVSTSVYLSWWWHLLALLYREWAKAAWNEEQRDRKDSRGLAAARELFLRKRRTG